MYHFSLKVHKILDHSKYIGVIIFAHFHMEADCLSLMLEYNSSSSVFNNKTSYLCYGQHMDTDTFKISNLYEKTPNLFDF